MIRIVKDVFCARTESPNRISRFRMVPASGTVSIEDEHDGTGWLRTVKLEFRIYKWQPDTMGDLLLWVHFEDGGTMRIGTPDLPVRLKFGLESYIKVSCEWQSPLG